MTTSPRSSLEQWSVLRAVVEQGGYAQAAAHLHKSQSSVSYAVARLQEALGLALVATEGRRTVLTPQGRALLDDAIPLIDDLLRLEQRARQLASGGLSHVRLLIDSLYPRDRLFTALGAFARAHPGTALELRELVRAQGSTLDPQDHDLAVVMGEPGLPAQDLGVVALVAVAHAAHPLAGAPAPISAATLARHVRADIVGMRWAAPEVRERSRHWEVNTLDAAVQAVRRGLCYAWLPEHLVHADLAQGTLRRLDLATGATRRIALVLLHGAEVVVPGPALDTLAALLRQGLAESAPADDAPAQIIARMPRTHDPEGCT